MWGEYKNGLIFSTWDGCSILVDHHLERVINRRERFECLTNNTRAMANSETGMLSENSDLFEAMGNSETDDIVQADLSAYDGFSETQIAFFDHMDAHIFDGLESLTALPTKKCL